MLKKDLKFLKLLQGELPLVSRPFDVIAKKTGIPVSEVLKKIKALKASGAIRRFGAVIHHRKTGYAYNAMTAVQAEPEVIQELVNRILKIPAITHCYERPAYPDWPFNLYFMLHTKTKAESRSTLKALFSGLKIKKKKALYSTREFKKISFRL